MTILWKSRSVMAAAADEAAAWLARKRSLNWSLSDESEFAVWLSAHPSHRVVWASYVYLWSRLETVRNDSRIVAIRTEARRSAAARQVLRRRWVAGAAVAAS